MRHHHELSLQESWNYALLTLCTCFTNQSESSHNTKVMYKQLIIQLMLSNSYAIKQHTISISTSYINHGIIPQTLLVKHLDQTSKQHISEPFNNSTKTYPQSRSGEGGPLAQASPFSPR